MAQAEHAAVVALYQKPSRQLRHFCPLTPSLVQLAQPAPHGWHTPEKTPKPGWQAVETAGFTALHAVASSSVQRVHVVGEVRV